MAEEVRHKLAPLPAGTRFWGASGKVVYMVLDLANLPGSHRAHKGEVWAVVLSSPADTTSDYRPGTVRAFRDTLPVRLAGEPDEREGTTVLVTNPGRRRGPSPNPIQDPPGGEG